MTLCLFSDSRGPGRGAFVLVRFLERLFQLYLLEPLLYVGTSRTKLSADVDRHRQVVDDVGGSQVVANNVLVALSRLLSQHRFEVVDRLFGVRREHIGGELGVGPLMSLVDKQRQNLGDQRPFRPVEVEVDLFKLLGRLPQQLLVGVEVT